jgi:hypothetical protein
MLLVLTLACVVQPLPAQFARNDRVGLHIPIATRQTPNGALMMRAVSESHPSYWLEGGMVTGLGLLLVGLPWLLDGDGSVPVKILRAGFVVGVGFAPGALIGGLIPKYRAVPDAPSRGIR